MISVSAETTSIYPETEQALHESKAALLVIKTTESKVAHGYLLLAEFTTWHLKIYSVDLLIGADN